MTETRLVVAPGFAFSELDMRLGRLGWTRRAASTTTPSLLPGEPEIAQWQAKSGDTLLTYTFNPVVHLRVLDFSGDAASAHRAALAATLPVLRVEDLAHSLQSDDVRSVLRSILAAAELEAFELAAPIGLVAGHRDAAVAAAAARAHLDLLHAQARAWTRTDRSADLAVTLGAICGNAMPLLATLPDAEADEILGLQPAEEDYHEVFAEDLARPLAAAYDGLWKRPPRVSPGPARRDLRVHACPASLFGSDNPFARRFPTGYRSIAPALHPDRVWLAWRYCAPGQDTGLAFDGLVFVRGNWVWFPKPFDVIIRALGVRP